MPYRFIPFTDDGFYHIYNRGVEKRQIFINERDFQRFLHTLYFYQYNNPKVPFSRKEALQYQGLDFTNSPKFVDIICYCLMPNHFHLVLKQTANGDIHKFMQKVLNSYTKYFNTKHKRVGPLLQGTFKAVSIEDDTQLIHVSRYIHLNPYVSNLVKDLDNYPQSSYSDYIDKTQGKICNKKPVLSLFKNPADYQEFVSGNADYAKELEIMKHLLMEEE
ncbi:MAG: transposase [Candidatus Daviesbacteria bacterium]|nr:transposase [Candidatus Daviesbacteria bacterium]